MASDQVVINLAGTHPRRKMSEPANGWPWRVKDLERRVEHLERLDIGVLANRIHHLERRLDELVVRVETRVSEVEKKQDEARRAQWAVAVALISVAATFALSVLFGVVG